MMFSASTIAAASIAASLNGMNWTMRTGIQYAELLQRLTEMTGVKQVSSMTCEYVARVISMEIYARA